MDKVRVMRILIYEGNRSWIENTLKNSYIPINGSKEIAYGKIISIANFPEKVIEGSDIN